MSEIIILSFTLDMGQVAISPILALVGRLAPITLVILRTNGAVSITVWRAIFSCDQEQDQPEKQPHEFHFQITIDTPQRARTAVLIVLARQVIGRTGHESVQSITQ